MDYDFIYTLYNNIYDTVLMGNSTVLMGDGTSGDNTTGNTPNNNSEGSNPGGNGGKKRPLTDDNLSSGESKKQKTSDSCQNLGSSEKSQGETENVNAADELLHLLGPQKATWFDL